MYGGSQPCFRVEWLETVTVVMQNGKYCVKRVIMCYCSVCRATALSLDVRWKLFQELLETEPSALCVISVILRYLSIKY